MLRWLLLLLVFWLSGFAALLYQTAWAREFAFVFGTTELAVGAVLAAYFAGLASGAAVIGRHLSRVTRPLRLYALLELAVGILALAVPFAIRAAMQLHVDLFAGGAGALEETGAASLLFYVVAAFVILLLPTGCMGATLPLLVRHAVHDDRELGLRVARLYGINTFGAVFGVLAAGFWLVPNLGLARTVELGAGVNGLVFLLALALARGEARRATAPPVAVRRAAFDWILPCMLVSGTASFLYEVLWTRLLAHVVGGSLYGFATMLATFLVGIALGASLASLAARSRRAAARGFVVAQLGTAGFSALALRALDSTPDLMAWLATQPMGSVLAEGIFSAVILLPGALAIGATFPLAVRILASGAGEAGPASARVYAWNTFGSILGALGAGFLVIPHLGFAGAAGAAIALNLALAGFVALRPRARSLPLGGCALAGVAALLLLPPSPPLRLLRSSPFSQRIGTDKHGEIIHRAVGRSASVVVFDELGEYLLRLNGLPESAIQPPGARPQRYLVAQWLGALPTLMRPDLDRLLIVGLGGGIAIEAVPASVGSIDVVEIERETLHANRVLAELRREDPLSDPRVRVHVNDARNALLLTQRRFDAIVSQPSHPWTVGASHLYTREFFALVRSRLEADGVFVQWIGLHFVDEPLLRTLVATLRDVFPHVHAYRPARRPALLFAASSRPLPERAEIARVIARDPAAYTSVGLFDALDLEAAWVLDSDGVRGFAAGAPLNLDRHNRLEARSPWVVRSGSGRRSPLDSLTAWDPLPRRIAALPPTEMIRRLLERGELARARRLLASVPAGPDRMTARGLVSLSRRQQRRALRLLESALDRASRQPEARAALLRMAAGPHARPAPVPAPLTELEAACWSGWRLRRAGDWEGARALEPALASAQRRQPLQRDADLLRAWWRVASGSPLRAREALAILDPIVAGDARPAGLMLRARAALRAGWPQGAVSTLSELVAQPVGKAQRAAVDRGIDALLAALPEDGPYPRWKAQLEQQRAERRPLQSGATPP